MRDAESQLGLIKIINLRLSPSIPVLVFND